MWRKDYGQKCKFEFYKLIKNKKEEKLNDNFDEIDKD